jgi:hypothetical protein
MLVDHIGCAEHIVVEKEQDVVSRLGRSAVAGRRGATVGLIDDAKREGELQCVEGLDGAVSGPVDYDYDLSRTFV